MTAVAYTGFAAPGLEVIKMPGDGDVRVDVENSILQGAEDVGGNVDVTADNQSGSGSVEVFASHSNLNQTDTSAAGGNRTVEGFKVKLKATKRN